MPSPLFIQAQALEKTIAWSFTKIHRCSYQEGIELQNQYYQKVLENPFEAYALFLEHPSTLTLGYRLAESTVEKELELFRSKNYDIVRSERGGLLTLHNPGQLLCYPIVNLRSLDLGAREWIEHNLLWIKNMLHSYSVPAHYKMDSVGVFTEKGKIASLGFRIKNGISTHGFAINVNNDLNDFYQFNPCGLCQVGADRIKNYSSEVTLEEVRSKLPAPEEAVHIRIDDRHDI